LLGTQVFNFFWSQVQELFISEFWACHFFTCFVDVGFDPVIIRLMKKFGTCKN